MTKKERAEQRRRALSWIRHAMRDFAQAKRKAAFGKYLHSSEDLTFGMMLGARSTATILGAITEADNVRLSARIDKLNRANVSRPPFRLVRTGTE